MTLPQNTNSSPRSLCDLCFAVKIFIRTAGFEVRAVNEESQQS